MKILYIATKTGHSQINREINKKKGRGPVVWHFCCVAPCEEVLSFPHLQRKRLEVQGHQARESGQVLQPRPVRFHSPCALLVVPSWPQPLPDPEVTSNPGWGGPDWAVAAQSDVAGRLSALTQGLGKHSPRERPSRIQGCPLTVTAGLLHRSALRWEGRPPGAALPHSPRDPPETACFLWGAH